MNMLTKTKILFFIGIDVDIDVEHEGKRTKVTPTPSTGPPSGRSDSGSIGLLSRGSGPESQTTEVSTSEEAKVILY